MFKSQKAWAEKCEGLEARVKELESDAQAHDEAITKRDNRIKELEASAATGPTAEQVTKLEADLKIAQEAAAPDKIQAAAVALVSADAPPEPVQKVIAARVTEALSAAGAPNPIKGEEGGSQSEAKVMKRDAFSNLGTKERADFISGGGKLTD